MPAPPPSTLATRAVQLFLAGVIGVAFVGLVVGLRQGATPYEPAEPVTPRVHETHTAIRATAYREFDRRIHGPNAGWRSTLADLAQPDPEPIDSSAPPHWDESSRADLLAQRAQRRAYDGAPPVVPHPIDQMSASSCYACHGPGLHIAGVRAPQMSHGFLRNCTQCHVEQRSPDLSPSFVVRNDFHPLQPPLTGSRAWDGAPPTIPHTTFMRDNCLSCHGDNGPDPIRTTHPWRANCLQCHAPSADLDQRPLAGESLLAPLLQGRSR